jgi:hypothetical protein
MNPQPAPSVQALGLEVRATRTGSEHPSGREHNVPGKSEARSPCGNRLLGTLCGSPAQFEGRSSERADRSRSCSKRKRGGAWVHGGHHDLDHRSQRRYRGRKTGYDQRRRAVHRGPQATARTPERSLERMKARRSLQGCADPSVALTNGIERNEPPADRAPLGSAPRSQPPAERLPELPCVLLLLDLEREGRSIRVDDGEPVGHREAQRSAGARLDADIVEAPGLPRSA